ncbi:MAG: hypothetical protein K5851_05595 [Lachnospiraceae bacterium]|nr:hypothetical protein [Lachnospiraceae bacterium]
MEDVLYEIVLGYFILGICFIYFLYIVKKKIDDWFIPRLSYSSNHMNRTNLLFSEEDIFGKGLTQSVFVGIVRKAEKRFDRVTYLKPEGACIYGAMLSQTGKTTYCFRITFNNNGHVDGKYKYVIDSNYESYGSNLVQKVAGFISREIRDYRMLFVNNSSMCPECGRIIQSGCYCISCGYDVKLGVFNKYMDNLYYNDDKTTLDYRKKYIREIVIPQIPNEFMEFYLYLINNLKWTRDIGFAEIYLEKLNELSKCELGELLYKNHDRKYIRLKKYEKYVRYRKKAFLNYKNYYVVFIKRMLLVWLIYSCFFLAGLGVYTYYSWKSNQVVLEFDENAMLGKNVDVVEETFNSQGFENVDVSYKRISYKKKSEDKKVYDIEIDSIKSIRRNTRIDRRKRVVIKAYYVKRVYSPEDSEAYEKCKLNNVREKLKKAGFVNIKTRNNKKLKLGLFHKQNEVEKVIIDKKTEFDEYEEFYPDAKVIIVYYGK